jgi:hypothetical protein
MSLNPSGRVGAAVVALAGIAAVTAPTRAADAQDRKRACVDAATEGQTLRQADKLLEARDALSRCAVDACPAVVRSHCVKWLGELATRIPTVIVRVQDDAGGDVFGAEVTLDGKPATIGRPTPIDPGEHAVAVVGPQGEHQEAKFLVIDGEAGRVVAVKMRATKPAAPAVAGGAAPQPATTDRARSSHGIPLGAWIVGGLGVAALGTSGYFAVVTSNDLDTLRHTCSPSCTDAQMSTGKTHAVLTDTLLGVGAAAVGVGVVWAILGSGSSSGVSGASAAIEASPVPGGAVVSVRGAY